MIRPMKTFCSTARRSCGRSGERARQLNIRLLAHPEQFVVLSSDSPNVVANSIRTLRMHARILDMLGQPRSYACPMELHGGKSDRPDALVSR